MSTRVDAATVAAERNWTATLARFVRGNFFQFTLLIELLLIFALFAILTNGTFVSPRNLSNLLMQSVTFALIAIPMVLVMVQGHIDLSVGSVIGFLGTAAATMQVVLGWGTMETIIGTLILGVAVGLWHGLWVALFNLPAFIVTLTGMLIFKGLNLLVGNGAAIGPVSPSFAAVGNGFLPSVFFEFDTTLLIAVGAAAALIAVTISRRRSQLSYGLPTRPWWQDSLRLFLMLAAITVITAILMSYRGISWAMLLLLGAAALFTFVADGTPLGRYVYAIGGNLEAARLSGVSLKRTTIMVFLVMGLLSGLASIVFLGRVGQATALTGTGFEFTVITGCIVGGVSTLGGHGRILGAIIGTILMASLDNGMSLLNLGTTYQYIVKGLVLLFAVALDVASRRKTG